MEMVFRRIEYWIEGDWTHQKKLRKSAWTKEKILKKFSKHLIFWIISFLIANTFLAYIIGSDELFKIQTNTNILHVPYKGSSLALNDLLGGQVSSIFDNMPSVLQQVRAGKLRALGVTTATRSSFAPDIPTLAESGLPNFSVQAWFGLFAPSAADPSLVKRVNANVTRALAAEATKTSYASAGIAIPPNPNTVETFTAFVSQEVQKWATVVKQSGTETQ
jgi:tripartite-type tricarboxylate transporter receptor subunit TctC